MYSINHLEKEKSGNKFLIVCQGDNLEIFEYVKTISNPEVVNCLHLMDFKHKVEDNDIMYYYTIGDRVSLKETAENKGLSKSVFINIISTIVRAICEAREYGLSEKCFIIDRDFIYVGEVDTLLTYLPVEMTVDVKAEFRRLMDFLSDKLIDAKDVFEKIKKMIKTDFSFEELYSYCNDMETRTIEEGEQHRQPSFLANSLVNPMFNRSKAIENAPEQDQAKMQKQEKRKFFSFLGKKETKVKKEDIPKGKMPRDTVSNHEEMWAEYTKDEDVFSKRETASEKKRIAYMLCNNPEDKIERKRVDIKFCPFSIGRGFPGSISSTGLLIARKYVSSRHAAIISDGNKFFMMDIGTEGTGSKGGTYVNDVRIIPNVKTPLKNGDKVRFFQLEYTFYVE